MYLYMLQVDRIEDAYRFFDEFKEKFTINQENRRVIDELENIPERKNLNNKYYAKFLDK